mmetsp:Transcript_10997/g.19604  ORF Transcript_10997/g.19604 Transcript_10997/m.19604 type:complete len:229 (-) Transcript_10997:1135-1821(-)
MTKMLQMPFSCSRPGTSTEQQPWHDLQPAAASIELKASCRTARISPKIAPPTGHSPDQLQRLATSTRKTPGEEPWTCWPQHMKIATMLKEQKRYICACLLGARHLSSTRRATLPWPPCSSRRARITGQSRMQRGSCKLFDQMMAMQPWRLSDCWPWEKKWQQRQQLQFGPWPFGRTSARSSQRLEVWSFWPRQWLSTPRTPNSRQQAVELCGSYALATGLLEGTDVSS